MRNRIADEMFRLTGRLARLDGAAVVGCAEGPRLVWVDGVVDPLPLIEAIRSRGAPTVDSLVTGLRMKRPPMAFGATDLASAHHDLERLGHLLRRRDAADMGPRLVRRRAADGDWLRDRLAHLGELSRELKKIRPAHPPTDAAGVLEAVLQLARVVHGDDQVRVFAKALALRREATTARREEARARVLELSVGLMARGRTSAAAAEGADDRARMLDEARARIEALEVLPGRARARRIRDVLRSVLAWPDSPPPSGGGALPPGAAAQRPWQTVLTLGAPLVHELAAPPVFDAIVTAAACFALAFRADAGRAPLKDADVTLMTSRLDDARTRLAGADLTLDTALALLKLGPSGKDLSKLSSWIQRGVSLESLQAVAAADQLEAMLELETARASGEYARWLILLVPHYQAAGIRFALPTRLFPRLRHARSVPHAVLAACISAHHLDPPAPFDVDHALESVAFLVDVFGPAADPLRAATETMRAVPDGIGRRVEPDLAAWLDDDQLLDRYLHVAGLAGEPAAVSDKLRVDHERTRRRASELAHLESLTDRSELQERRLVLLRAGDAAPTSTSRTRRALGERIEQLWPAAWRNVMERAWIVCLRRGWKIRVGELTEGWRVALRYWLLADDNEKLLGTLLRWAAGHDGQAARRALPECRAWCERARERFDVDAWLAPRERDVTIGGERYVLSVERDPIEVLRMGMPFDTCLSLDEGVNAASTVVNALEPNKQVLYLKSGTGKIVARKLLAVSKTFELLGYRVYSALDERHTEAVEAAFAAECEDIARCARLRLGSIGAPESVLGGFWYDDDPVAFREPPASEVSSYCEHLRRPVPEAPNALLVEEARAWVAAQRGDVERALELLSRDRTSPAQEALAAELVAHLGERGAERRASSATQLVPWLLRFAARSGPSALLEKAAAFAAHASSMPVAISCLRAFAPSREVGVAIARAARRSLCHGFDQQGLAHQSLSVLPQHAAAAQHVRAFFDLCDEIQPAWDAVAGSDECADCHHRAVACLNAAALAVYARRPDTAEVLRCLRARRGELAHRAALRIVASFTLVPRARAPLTGPWFLHEMEEAPAPCPAVVRAVDRVIDRRPALAGEPDAFAALLRHGIGPPSAAGLPTTSPPFEALGSLHLWSPGLYELLERWSAPEIAPSAWEPGPWELHHHRKHVTPWRIRLQRVAAEDSKEGRAAIRWLGMLGATDALTRIEQGTAFRTEHRRAAWEARTASSVDVCTKRRARQVLHAALVDASEGDESDAELAAARDLLVSAEEPTNVLAVLEAALARGALGPALEACAHHLLRTRPDACHLALSPRLVVQLWQVPALREDMLAILTHVAPDDAGPFWASIESAARDTTPARPIAGLFERWIVEMVRGYKARPLWSLEPDLLERAFRAIRGMRDAAFWLLAFRGLPDHAAAAIALDDIERAWRAASGVLTPSPDEVATAAAASGSWTDGLHPTLREWLDASIATERGRRSAARSAILSASDPVHVAPPSHP